MKINVDYIIISGKWIFTKEYLLKRGYCCYNGCLNCPYKNMKKDLYMKESPNKNTKSVAPIVQQDDLVYDGKNLIIPSYWASTIKDYLDNLKEENITEDDKEDLTTFKSFIEDVVYSKNS